MKLIKELQPNTEDASIWMGGEATLGPQAEDHVRWREKNVDGFAMVILGLAFGGGFALGSALCHLWWRTPTR